MAQQHLSNASLHKIYEGDDQEKYTPSDVSSAASKSGINTAGYSTHSTDSLHRKLLMGTTEDKNKILNELHEEAVRFKHCSPLGLASTNAPHRIKKRSTRD